MSDAKRDPKGVNHTHEYVHEWCRCGHNEFWEMNTREGSLIAVIGAHRPEGPPFRARKPDTSERAEVQRCTCGWVDRWEDWPAHVVEMLSDNWVWNIEHAAALGSTSNTSARVADEIFEMLFEKTDDA